MKMTKKNNTGFIETPIKEQLIYSGKIFDLRKDEIETEEGLRATREYVKHNGGVCILAVNKEGKIAIINQYRYPVKAECLELPAGKLEKDEDPMEGALRELEEEIGFRAKKIEDYGVTYPCVGYSSEIIHLYVATELVETHTNFDEDERIKCKWFTVQEIRDMLETNIVFKDSKTIVLLYKYLHCLDKQAIVAKDTDLN